MKNIWRSACTFSGSGRGTPKRRIVRDLAILLGGLALAACSSSRDPSGPSDPLSPGSIISYTAIGASDALGVGSSVICLPFAACPQGKGYVYVAASQLEDLGHTVTLRNLGIPTAVLSQRIQTLGVKYHRDIFGNFLTDELPFAVSGSTLISIFAGGNDVNTPTAAIGAGEATAAGLSITAYVDQQVALFGADYATLVQGLRAGSPAARIVALNLPNIGALPSLAGAPLSQRQAAQRLAVGITTTVINPLAAQGIAVVDLMCEPRIYDPARLASDGFHPNDAGYAILADAVVRTATQGTYAAPRSTCPQMTVVP
jgi:lysophospholipase L1-like esterase